MNWVHFIFANRAEEQRSRGAEEQRSRGAEEQRKRITANYKIEMHPMNYNIEFKS